MKESLKERIDRVQRTVFKIGDRVTAGYQLGISGVICGTVVGKAKAGGIKIKWDNGSVGTHSAANILRELES